MNVQIKLAPPLVTLIKKVEALFGQDPDIRIEADAAATTPKIKLYVANPCKAAALAALLPESWKFGSVECLVVVISDNGDAGEFANAAETVSAAFDGNPAVAVIRPVSKGLFKNLVYVAFKREVVQFFNDDLADINGNWNGLYASIAKELFTNADGVFFCTAAGDGFGAPLGEWP